MTLGSLALYCILLIAVYRFFAEAQSLRVVAGGGQLILHDQLTASPTCSHSLSNSLRLDFFSLGDKSLFFASLTPTGGQRKRPTE